MDDAVLLRTEYSVMCMLYVVKYLPMQSATHALFALSSGASLFSDKPGPGGKRGYAADQHPANPNLVLRMEPWPDAGALKLRTLSTEYNTETAR